MARTTTSSSRGGELSFRLSKLHDKHHEEENIWDIGCDHGLLGLSFLDDEKVKSVHLVDPSILVIETLQNKLKDAYISKDKLFVHHKRGQEIIPSSHPNAIFIAGMGGKEIGEIIQALLPYIDESSRIIISPHRKILELRSLLNSLPVRLLEEEVIEEDGQFYQILVLKPSLYGKRVSHYGEALWSSECGKRYREHQILHFKVHKDEASMGYVKYLTSI